MPDTAGSPGHQFRLTAREVGLCDESSHAGNKRDPKAAESTALGGRRVCVSARVPSRPWRPATAPGLAPFNRAAKRGGRFLTRNGVGPVLYRWSIHRTQTLATEPRNAAPGRFGTPVESARTTCL